MLEIVKAIVGPLVGGLSGYYNLPAYGRALYKQTTGKVIEYGKEETFWKDVIGPYFYQPAQTNVFEGQLVKLIDFQVSEWFPRCPGLYWTVEGQRYREDAQRYMKEHIQKYRYIVFAPRGKTKMILGGLGTTRLELHKGDHDDYKLLCATSSGKCDAGIPLVVTKGVWEQIRELILSEGVVQADVLAFYSPLPVKYENLLVSTGAELVGNVRNFLSYTLHVPRHCLLVESGLQIKKKRSKSPIQATAWTLFKTGYADSVLPYSFTYHSFDPRNEVSIKDAAEFIQDYVTEHNGKEILTEFDEKIQRLSSVNPLSSVMKCEVDQSFEQQHILKNAEMLRGFEEF